MKIIIWLIDTSQNTPDLFINIHAFFAEKFTKRI